MLGWSLRKRTNMVELSTLIGRIQTWIKVGAHFGLIVASRLGGRSYHHITAAGDTVNVASRLMEVAANHGVELALSDELLRVAGHAAVFKSGVLMGPHETRIRGRSGAIAIWLWRTDGAGDNGRAS